MSAKDKPIPEPVREYFARIGQKGGKATTEAKREAVRENGKRGGRPKEKHTK